MEDYLRELDYKGLVGERFAGVLDDVLEDLRKPMDPPRAMPRMLEHYRRLLGVPSEADGPEFDDEDLFGPRDPIWSRGAAEVGPFSNARARLRTPCFDAGSGSGSRLPRKPAVAVRA